MLGVTRSEKKYLLIFGVVFSLLATYELSNLAVQKKWELRFKYAKTAIEKQKACADGANLVFNALLFAPIEAVFYTWFFAYLGRHITRSKKEKKSNFEIFVNFLKKRPIIVLLMSLFSLMVFIVSLVLKSH